MLQDDDESNPPTVFTKLVETKHHAPVELMSISPTMDVIVLVSPLSNSNSVELSLWRIMNWQRVWNWSCPFPNAQISSLTWRPDGKVLAVAFDNSKFVLLDAETSKELFRSESLSPASSDKPVRIVHSNWIEFDESGKDLNKQKKKLLNEESSDEEFDDFELEYSLSHLRDRESELKAQTWESCTGLDEQIKHRLPLLSNLPSLRQGSGKFIIKSRDPFSMQSFEHFHDKLNILILVDDSLCVHLVVFGVFVLDPVRIPAHSGDVSVKDSFISPDLSTLFLILQQDNPSSKFPLELIPIPMKVWLKTNGSTGNESSTNGNTGNEQGLLLSQLAKTSMRWSQLNQLLFYLSQVSLLISREWEEWDRQASSFISVFEPVIKARDDMLDCDDKSVSRLLLDLLMTGQVPSTEMEIVLTKDLGQRKLTRFHEGLEAVLFNLNTLIQFYLKPCLERLILYLEDHDGGGDHCKASISICRSIYLAGERTSNQLDWYCETGFRNLFNWLSNLIEVVNCATTTTTATTIGEDEEEPDPRLMEERMFREQLQINQALLANNQSTTSTLKPFDYENIYQFLVGKTTGGSAFHPPLPQSNDNDDNHLTSFLRDQLEALNQTCRLAFSMSLEKSENPSLLNDLAEVEIPIEVTSKVISLHKAWNPSKAYLQLTAATSSALYTLLIYPRSINNHNEKPVVASSNTIFSISTERVDISFPSTLKQSNNPPSSSMSLHGIPIKKQRSVMLEIALQDDSMAMEADDDQEGPAVADLVVICRNNDRKGSDPDGSVLKLWRFPSKQQVLTGLLEDVSLNSSMVAHGCERQLLAIVDPLTRRRLIILDYAECLHQDEIE